MNLKKIGMRFRWLLGSFKWILVALIIIVAIIDLSIYYYFVSFESTFDGKIRILTILAPFTSVAIAAIGISYQVQSTKEREIQFKIHQQRKETYEEFLALLEKVMKLSKEGDKEVGRKMEDDYRALRPKLITYASPVVISIYTDIIDPRLQQNRDSISTVKKYVELFLQIRSEAGFAGEDLPTRQLVSLILTDINEPIYNNIFDEKGYLK